MSKKNAEQVAHEVAEGIAAGYISACTNPNKFDYTRMMAGTPLAMAAASITRNSLLKDRTQKIIEKAEEIERQSSIRDAEKEGQAYER